MVVGHKIAACLPDKTALKIALKATPVSHIWYFKGIPSRMGLLLDISPRILEKVLYFANYIVTDPGETQIYNLEIICSFPYKYQ